MKLDRSRWVYVQPEHVLDLAWDDYMERTLHLPPDAPINMAQLAKSGIDPAVLSMIFDLAITAVRRHVPRQPCCEAMTQAQGRPCAKHPEPFDCPDVLVIRTRDGRLGIPIRDGGSSVSLINFCPWCGARLVSEGEQAPDAAVDS